MKEKATYGCRMWVDTGEENPNIFTELTGILPTEIKIKGEYKTLENGNRLLMKQNLWELKPPKRTADDEWDLCNSIEDITNQLDEKEAPVQAALQRFENKGLLFYGDVYSYWVQFRVQPEILYKMHKYKMLIDFSIMSFEDPDDE